MNRTETAQILPDAVERADGGKVNRGAPRRAQRGEASYETVAARLVLGCGDSEKDIGRSQNTRAAFLGIPRQLGLPDE